jgi:hypothetical protein
MTSKPVPGSCFCGTVQFTIDLPTLFCGHCHCSMCRRPHGAAFVTWTAVPPNQLTIYAGEEQITRFECGPPKGVRSFCSKCGSHLFGQVEKDEMGIVMAALNGPIDRLPEEHYYYDSRADWIEINDNLPKLGGVDGIQPLD